MSQRQVTTDEYFGGCPECGKSTGHVNVERVHWGTCDEHKTKWPIGENLFSSWHDEDEVVWKRNRNLLETYRMVDPIFPHTTECPRCSSKTIGQDEYPHSPLCRNLDGTETNLSDDTVRSVLKVLDERGYRVVDSIMNPEIPF